MAVEIEFSRDDLDLVTLAATHKPPLQRDIKSVNTTV